jgi:hypothetical protein
MPVDGPPVTSPTDPRIASVAGNSVAGEDQIDQMLAATPLERLRCLVEMIEFEERAHSAKLVPKAR